MNRDDAAGSLHLPGRQYYEGAFKGDSEGAAGGSSNSNGSLSQLCSAQNCRGVFCVLVGKTTRAWRGNCGDQSREGNLDIPEDSDYDIIIKSHRAEHHQHNHGRQKRRSKSNQSEIVLDK